MPTIGQTLVKRLEYYGVEVIFGIPGVHTIELYRGMEESSIRHITPRHEQGAGFMADGYARVTGKHGVAFVITGPGLTNIITPMAQARADSVPLLVISSANPNESAGQERGHLHELPDQHALVATLTHRSFQIEHVDDLQTSLVAVFESSFCERPGPFHIEIPTDVAKVTTEGLAASSTTRTKDFYFEDAIEQAVEIFGQAQIPVILAGGGMRFENDLLKELAEKLDAPVVLTTNGRGLLHGHDLAVPASPSLKSVRGLIEASDAVLALGTELGRTDFDMYETGSMPTMSKLVRVDISQTQLSHRDALLNVHADGGQFAQMLMQKLPIRGDQSISGPERAAFVRGAAFDEIGPEMQSISNLLTVLRDAAPDSIFVGDSTQPVYAGNLYYDHDRPGGWFNASTGYGALGYGIPAAIGAAIGAPNTQVICLCGDGGAQFSLPELMVAVDEKLPIVFVIWNNHGYREIETSMLAAGVAVAGCNPTPPDFGLVAKSCGIEYFKSGLHAPDVDKTIKKALALKQPVVVELET